MPGVLELNSRLDTDGANAPPVSLFTYVEREEGEEWKLDTK